MTHKEHSVPIRCEHAETVRTTPKTFSAKLMSPLIRLGVGKQTRQAAANLKKLLESTTA
jgi:hypothetical protein